MQTSLRTAQDALLLGMAWHCPECRQLLGRQQEDGTVVSLIRRLGHHFPNGEVRFRTYGGTITMMCWRCGAEVVFRVSGASVVV